MNRRDNVWSNTNTTKKADGSSIGSDRRPCWWTAVDRSDVLERGHEEVRPGARHAAEDAGGDRRGDDRGDDPAHEPGDGHEGDTEVASDDQQADESDDRPDDEDRDQIGQDREQRVGLRFRVEEREIGASVEGMNP